MSNSNAHGSRYSALTALVEKWNELTRERRLHHPESPPAIEESIGWIKRFGERLLGYEPPVVLHKLKDRWLIDVSLRGTTPAVAELRTVLSAADHDLMMKHPHFSWEFRIEGQRFPEFVQGRDFSRTRFDREHPSTDLRDLAFTIEGNVRERFGTEPFIAVYQTAKDRFDFHVSLETPALHDALRGRLRSVSDVLREQHPLLDFRLVVDREPLSPGRSLTEPRGPALDLDSLDFDPALRQR